MFASFADVAAAFPWFFPLCALLLGACVGSFLNVVIYRVPAEKSIVTPGSHCACGQPIKWRDNIPVLSWLLLRGRARCCGQKFSFRYPFVELLTAALFVACWLHFPPAVAACGWIFLSCLVAATFIDLDHMIIPDAFTIGGAAAGILLSLLLPALHGQAGDYFLIASIRSGREALFGLFIGSALVLWIALFAEALLKREAMGFGDVKYLGAIGTFVGWKGAVFGMFGGAVLGCAWFLLAYLWKKAAGRNAPAALPAETPEGQPAELGFGVHVPFGPMLGVAALIYFFRLHPEVDEYFGRLAELF